MSTSSKSPSLRRIQADIRELALDPSDRYHATPLENDMFEWHFTIRGAPKTDFEGGVYHGRILLPPEYPFKPPHIIFLTPSGRFETNTKICLSFSAFHPELWQPAWGVRLILEALIAFLPSPADGAIGALDWSSAERKRLAKESVNWSCPHCGKIVDLLPKLKPAGSEGEGAEGAGESSSSATKSRFQKEIEELKRLQELEHKQSDADKKDKPDEGEDKSSGYSNSTSSGDAKMPPSSQQQEDGAEEEHGTPGSHATAAAVAATTDEGLKKAPQGTATTAEKVTVETVRLGDESDEELVNPPATSTTAAATGFLDDVPNQNPFDPVLFPENNQVNGGGGVDNDNINNNDMKTSWLIDPVLHAIILILSIICCLLLKKIQALCQDLRHINLG